MTEKDLIQYPPHSCQPKGGKYYAVFRWAGKTKWLGLGVGQKGVAKSLASKAVRDWIDRERNKPKPIPPPVANVLVPVVAEYMADEYPPQTKQATRQPPERHLTRLIEYASLPALRYLDESALDRAIEVYRARHPLNQNGLREVLYNWKKFFGWAIEKGYLAKMPFHRKRHKHLFKKGLSKTGQVWTPEEYKTILEASTPRDRPVIEFAWRTGVYCADMYRMTPDDIKYPVGDSGEVEPKIYLARAKNKESDSEDPYFYDQPLTKNGYSLIQKLLASLEKENKGKPAKSKETKVFFQSIYPAKKETTFSSGIAKRLNLTWNRIYPGRPSKGIRDLRHTFITRMAKAGVRIDILARWVGHASDSTMILEVYAHLDSTAGSLPVGLD